MKRSIFFFLIALSTYTLANATTIPGNGATGFGGAVGTGSLSVVDSAGGMSITLNRGAGSLNDALVLYFDTQPGGFVDNTSFFDNGDGGRTAISGTNNGNPSKTQINLPFAADIGMAIENGFIGTFGLASGGNNSFNFLFGQPQSGNNSDPSYTINISPAQMLQMGLTAGSGQTFQFVGSYISTSAYRSNETIGASITVPGDGAGNAGFNNPQTFPEGISYTLVPEPNSVVLCLLGIVGFALRRRSPSSLSA
jgi:hypothetical protein